MAGLKLCEWRCAHGWSRASNCGQPQCRVWRPSAPAMARAPVTQLAAARSQLLPKLLQRSVLAERRQRQHKQHHTCTSPARSLARAEFAVICSHLQSSAVIGSNARVAFALAHAQREACGAVARPAADGRQQRGAGETRMSVRGGEDEQLPSLTIFHAGIMLASLV